MFIVDDIALALGSAALSGLGAVGSAAGSIGGALGGMFGAGAAPGAAFAGNAATLGASTGVMAGVPSVAGIGSSLGLSASPFAAGAAGAAGTAAGAGGGLMDALGTAGGLMSGIGSLGGLLMPLIMGQKEDPAAHAARRQWERIRQPVSEVYSQLVYNPAMEGTVAPYSGGANVVDHWEKQGDKSVPVYKYQGGTAYHYAPRQSMQNVYSSYLEGQYGLPANVASAMTSQALSPARLGKLGVTSAGAAQGLAQAQAGVPGAAAGTMAAEIARKQDLLQSANRLAAFQTWRAQQVPGLIG